MLKLGFYFDHPLNKLPIQISYPVSTEYVPKGQVLISEFYFHSSNGELFGSNRSAFRMFKYMQNSYQYDAIVAVPKTTVYLLLDMVLLSLAENVVLATQEDCYAFESTFQSIIQDLHVHRESTLEKLGIHSP